MSSYQEACLEFPGTILTLSTVFPHAGREQGPAPFFTEGTGLEKCTPVGIQSLHPSATPSDGAIQVLEPSAPSRALCHPVSQAPARSSLGEVGGISLGLWKCRAGTCALVPEGRVPCSSTSIHPCLSSHPLML